MKENWKLWLNGQMDHAKVLFKEQREVAKQIHPNRQAVIGEETQHLDEEHVFGNNGPKGEEGKRGTI